ncbi:MAG: RNA polymerase sigma factor [Thermoanaerobaculia bacterium]
MNIDDDGFERIYRAYYGRVWRFYRICRVSDDEAHDYAQDAFKRFYERRNQVRGDDAWPFLQAIARSVLLNKIRDQKAAKRSARTLEIDDPDVGELAAPEAPDYAERQQHEMRRISLYAAMAKLPEGQRECLGLWLGGFKLEEIAQRMGISLDAVKSRLRDARRQLRAQLGPDALPEDEE